MNGKIGLAFLVMAALITLVPRFILPVCEYQGYNPMACSHTAIAEMFTGATIMAAAVGLILSRSAETLRWLSFISLVAGVSVVFVPEAIGYCHSGRMPCNYGTVPVLRLLGVLVILLSLAGFLLSFRGKRT